jgi:hypothetical protein
MIKAVTIYNKIDRLRKAIRREGTPAIQDAWDNLEPYVSTFMNGVADDGPRRENENDRSGSVDLGKT